MKMLLRTLKRLARNVADTFAVRSRLPLSALLEHDEHGGPTP